jgi:hypothetical protein
MISGTFITGKLKNRTVEESADHIGRTSFLASLTRHGQGGGLPGSSRTCRLQGCIGARVTSLQRSILRCDIDTLW